MISWHIFYVVLHAIGFHVTFVCAILFLNGLQFFSTNKTKTALIVPKSTWHCPLCAVRRRRSTKHPHATKTTLHLSFVFLAILHSYSENPLDSTEWSDEVRAVSTAALKPTISFISHPASSAASVTIFSLMVVFCHHTSDISIQFPSSITRKPFISDLLQVPRPEGSHNNTYRYCCFLCLYIYLDNWNSGTHSTENWFWKDAISNTELLRLFWWIEGKFTLSRSEIAPKQILLSKTDEILFGEAFRFS